MPMLTKNRFFNRNHCGRNAVDDDPVAMRASGKFTLRQIKDAITRVFMGKPVDKAVMTMDTDVRWANLIAIVKYDSFPIFYIF